MPHNTPLPKENDLPPRCCATCKHWGRDEPRPLKFAPCRYPLPEAILEYIANGTWDGIPAFMKIESAGQACDVWEKHQ